MDNFEQYIAIVYDPLIILVNMALEMDPKTWTAP